jgi:DNA-binding NarL/FixJ family response regulator
MCLPDGGGGDCQRYPGGTDGERYLSTAVSSALIDDYIQKSLSMGQAKDPLFLLNMREREILQLVAEGKGSGVIAATLNLSVSTVNTYRCRAMKKLGLRDLTELGAFRDSKWTDAPFFVSRNGAGDVGAAG